MIVAIFCREILFTLHRMNEGKKCINTSIPKMDNYTAKVGRYNIRSYQDVPSG